MAELRAPDPTLTAYIAEGWSIVLMEYTDGTPVAHRIDSRTGQPPCGHDDDDDAVSLAKYERWIAVPCRDCFPDARPPGYPAGPWCGNPDHAFPWCDDPDHFPHPHLAWQLP